MLPPLKIFFVLHEVLHSEKFQVSDFECDNSVSNFSLKTPKEGIFSTKFKYFYVSRKFLYFEEFKGDDFKYENLVFFSDFSLRNMQDFWTKILQIFYFSTKFCSLMNLWMLISNIAIDFQSYSPKTPKQSIVLFSGIFFCFFFFVVVVFWWQNQVADFKYDNSFFKRKSKNTHGSVFSIE